MPEITVAIPAYKPHHLAQAIASVLAQTFTDYELLISDDCPDESVRAVVAQFRDPRIRLIEGPRRGLVPNSVHLWENASADLLKFVYDDDFLLPFCLAELSRVLGPAPELVYAFSHRHIVDAGGRIIGSPRAIQGDKPVRFEPGVLAEWILRNMQNVVGEPSNVLIRRSAFADASCLSEYCGLPVRHMVDVCFYLNAAARGPCVALPHFHAAFRRHAAQVTSQTQAPAFAVGYLEWELFFRGAVQTGLVPPASAAEGIPRLELAYRELAPRFPEAAPFLAGAPRLQERLSAGETELVDECFRAAWEEAQHMINRRAAAA